MKYLAHYPDSLLAQVRPLAEAGRLGEMLLRRHPQGHGIRTDGALYAFAQSLRNEFMRQAQPVSKVQFDSKLHPVRHALGTHTTVSRVQGSKLKARHEIRIATLFREVPLEWLRMIVVHELAHLRVREHDKAFYALCTHMEPAYHQHEFDLRLYLTHLDLGGQALWTAAVAGDQARA